MLKHRDDVRDFPGRCWFNLSRRTVDLAGVVLLGAALLGAGEIGIGALLTLISGFTMFAGDAWVNPAHLREVAGCGVLAKLALVAVMAAPTPGAADVLGDPRAFHPALARARRPQAPAVVLGADGSGAQVVLPM